MAGPPQSNGAERVGIAAYGACIPRHRLPLGAIGGRTAREGGPEKAVAWNDEDSITLAVSAAVNCLRGSDRGRVDSVYFASTTHPFREKQAAALVARALDLPRELRCADFGNSLRAGTSALRAAADAVAAGTAECVLVVASDCRTGAPGSGIERNGGDGAAAFLVTRSDVIATLDAVHSVADEIIDTWRSDGEPFVHSWEDRFVVTEGFIPRTLEAARGLFAAADRRPDEFARVAIAGPDPRSVGSVLRALGIRAEASVDPMFGRLGNAGAAFAPLLLVAALESAGPGEALLVANYGDGADAMAFTTTDELLKLEPRRGVEWHLERRRRVASYDHYLKARDLAASEWSAPTGPGLSATVHFRDRDADLGLLGQRCNACGAVQFPSQRICESCFAKDDFSAYRLSDREGRLVTYTFDHFFPTPEPPTVVAIVDVDGARIHMQVVDCLPEQVSIGLRVEFEFRCIHRAGGRPNYYWKAAPTSR